MFLYLNYKYLMSVSILFLICFTAITQILFLKLLTILTWSALGESISNQSNPFSSYFLALYLNIIWQEKIISKSNLIDKQKWDKFMLAKRKLKFSKVIDALFYSLLLKFLKTCLLFLIAAVLAKTFRISSGI